jgi:hypothetical protein
MVTLLDSEAVISAMARELRPLWCFDIRGIAKFAAVRAGFSAADIRRFLDRAIDYERARRQCFPTTQERISR